ncbi:MAG: type II toxin-antitoxin system VapC family toxin [bacterium]
MAWVVDSCVILDIVLNDPEFAKPSARLLDRLGRQGLVLCPVSLVELAPCFGGEIRNVREFADLIGVDHGWDWMRGDTEAAAAAWSRHVSLERGGQAGRRPVADILIGAFALRVGGLITRNTGHVKPVFPTLPLAEPGASQVQA